MFQNDKTAIYEFIFIDHIVFIFTTFVKEFKQVNALGTALWMGNGREWSLL